MPVLRKTLNLTISENRIVPVDAESGDVCYDAGVQGENNAVVLAFALPPDWQGLAVNLYATAEDGVFDVASDVDGAVTLPLPCGVLNTPRLSVYLEGVAGDGVRKTADCVLRVTPSESGTVRPIPLIPSALQDLEDKINEAALGSGRARGTVWHCGAGVPGGVTDAADGDFYLDTASGEVYRMQGTAWLPAENLTGPAGAAGTTGPVGAAAAVSVGTVATGEPGSAARVTNSGTESAAVLDFVIPRGEPGSGGDDFLNMIVAMGGY